MIGPISGPGNGGPNSRDWTSEELMKVYEQEAQARRVIVKKAELVQSLTTFTVEAFKQLLTDDAFVAVLKAEGLTEMPRPLAKLLSTEAMQ